MLAGDAERDGMGSLGSVGPKPSAASGGGVTAGGLGAVPLLPPSHPLMQQAFAASDVPVLGGLDLLVAALLDPLDAGASGPLVTDVQRHLGVVYRSVLAADVHVVVT